MRGSKRKGLAPVLALAMLLAGCASRPDADVLVPVANAPAHGAEVTLLTATNRSRDGAGFGNAWAGHTSYERYRISVPARRKGAALAYPGRKLDPERQFFVTGREALTARQLVEDITADKAFNGTIGIFVHGYNYRYQEALFRAAQVVADSKIPNAPVMFSWPSTASMTGYVADRDAVLASRRELTALLALLAASPEIRQIVLFGHSMGGFLTMEAARELALERRGAALDKLAVVLAAPDIDVDVFKSQMRDIGRMKTPVTLLVSKKDRALEASSFISGERPRIGLVDVGARDIEEVAKRENLRVIDISAVEDTDGLGHDRYASLARFGSHLASFEANRKAGLADTGAFVFDSAGAIVASPFHLVGGIVSR